MRFQLSADASPLTRRAAAFCQQRLHLPELLMVVLFSVRPWVWAAAAAWLAGAPLAHRLEVRSAAATNAVPSESLAWHRLAAGSKAARIIQGSDALCLR